MRCEIHKAAVGAILLLFCAPVEEKDSRQGMPFPVLVFRAARQPVDGLLSVANEVQRVRQPGPFEHHFEDQGVVRIVFGN